MKKIKTKLISLTGTKQTETMLFLKNIKKVVITFMLVISLMIPNLLFAQFTQTGSKLVGTGGSGAQNQGYSCSINSDGTTAIVGAPHDGGATDKGAAWIYKKISGAWTQTIKLPSSTNITATHEGTSVAMSGDGLYQTFATLLQTMVLLLW